MTAKRLLLTVATALTVITTACSSGTPSVPTISAGASASDEAGHIIGVYEPYDPGSYPQVGMFARAVGQWPAIVSYYGNWGMPFQLTFASQVWAHGGETLIQIDPRGVSLAAIAAGRQDEYLRTYALAVKSFGHPVIVSFGQEMNGNWYRWGTGYTTPAIFVAAWRHIVNLFRAQGARNVTWLWDVNCSFPHSSPISEWWPGSSYVDWVGIDCYYVRKSDTFNSLFGVTIDAARQITSDPILIAETAVGPGAGVGKIEDLFNGVKESHMLGLVWFDEAQHDGIYHQDWRLEDDPAMLAAFRQAAAKSGD